MSLDRVVFGKVTSALMKYRTQGEQAMWNDLNFVPPEISEAVYRDIARDLEKGNENDRRVADQLRAAVDRHNNP